MGFRLKTGWEIETDRRDSALGMGFLSSRQDFGNRIIESKDRSQPSAPPRGTGAPTPAAPPAPSPSVALSLDWPLQAAERRRRLGQGARRREGQVVRGGAGQPRPSWCREGKQQVVAPSGRRLSEECLGIYKSTQNRSGRWHDP